MRIIMLPLALYIGIKMQLKLSIPGFVSNTQPSLQGE